MGLIALDLNGDGLADLAIVNNSSNNLSVLTAIPPKPAASEPAAKTPPASS